MKTTDQTESAASEPWRQFQRTHSETAFAAVVARHVSLVYGVAWRVTGNAEAARDVVQIVFLELFRKAQMIPTEVVLPGWLYRAATFAARKAHRSDQRRLTRETEAMRQHALQSDLAGENDPTAELLPLLDEALSRLPDGDRQALILRYLSQQNWHDVGESLGVTEEAARKRVERALDRLRDGLRQRGVAVSVPTLALALGAIASPSAPPAMAAGISALVMGAGVSPAVVATVVWTKWNLGLLVAAVVMIVPVVYQEVELRALRQSSLPAVIPPVSSTGNVPTTGANTEAPRADVELARLRGQAAQLRTEATARHRAAAANGITSAAVSPPTAGKLLMLPGVQVPIGHLVEAGNATPETAVQSSLAAYQDANLPRFVELQLMDESSRLAVAEILADSAEREHTTEQMAAEVKRDRDRGKAFEIVATYPDGPDRAEVELNSHSPGEPTQTERKVLGRTEHGWRLLPVTVPPVSVSDPQSVRQPSP